MTQGEVLDVAVDIRVGSPTFGRHTLIELDAAQGNCVYISAGLAHGFYVLEAPATLVYKVTSIYDRYSYSKEKMEAVQKLGAYVEQMGKRHRSQRVA